MQKELSEFKTDFEALHRGLHGYCQVRRSAQAVTLQTSTMLWYCKWPVSGPSLVEPGGDLH